MLVLAALAATVALAAATAGESSPKAGKTINIGWVGDKSGPTVVAQAPVLHAIKSYFRMINDRGGVNGDKINLIEKDDLYTPALALSGVKSVLDDDVSIVTGLGMSSAISSILPLLNAAKVPGLMNQATVKGVTYPFQRYMFTGNCNYSDQGDVALGYLMTRLKLKNLRGKVVGIAPIASASGIEFQENLQAVVEKLGGKTVVQTIPATIVSADTAATAFRDGKADMLLIGTAANQGIAILKSLAKFGISIPVSGHFGVANEVVYRSVPYDVAKNFVAVNCVTPPALAKGSAGKLAMEMGKKYGYPESEYSQANWSLGWMNAQLMVAALRNAKGNYSGDNVRKGFEAIKNLDTGGLGPKVTLDNKCHMVIRQVRPYTYSYKSDTLQPVGSYDQWTKWITNAYAAPGTCGKKSGSK
jgi:ABC-type branched-subunit amino acid transport system substrate-binding protein